MQLSESYEAILKLFLFAKQGKLALKEASLKSANGAFQAELLVEGPPEKIEWLVSKVRGSPYVLDCRQLD